MAPTYKCQKQTTAFYNIKVFNYTIKSVIETVK